MPDLRKLRGQIVTAVRKYPRIFRGTLAVRLQDDCGWMPWDIDTEIDALIAAGVLVRDEADSAILSVAVQHQKPQQKGLL